MSEDATSIEPKKHILGAWLLGVFLYMGMAMEVVADAGIMAIPFQAVMGAVFSTLLVGVASLLGFLLEIPGLSRIWYASVFVPVGVIALALAVLCFGQQLGMTTTLLSAKTGVTYKTLHPLVAYGSVFLAVFAALHFSGRRIQQKN